MATIDDIANLKTPRLLTVTNQAPGASVLHSNPKYFIWSWDHTAQTLFKILVRLAQREVISDGMISSVLIRTAKGEVAWLRSLGRGTRPPITRDGPDRAAHPGRWADVTGETADSYAAVLDDATHVSIPAYRRI